MAVLCSVCTGHIVFLCYIEKHRIWKGVRYSAKTNSPCFRPISLLFFRLPSNNPGNGYATLIVPLVSFRSTLLLNSSCFFFLIAYLNRIFSLMIAYLRNVVRFGDQVLAPYVVHILYVTMFLRCTSRSTEKGVDLIDIRLGKYLQFGRNENWESISVSCFLIKNFCGSIQAFCFEGLQ